MQTIAYEEDFAQWAFAQAQLLRNNRLQDLDLGNLIEELECMGRSEYRELRSRMSVLICHLLKWQFQENYRGNSWLRTIIEQRDSIALVLEDSPSLRNKLDDEEWLNATWKLGFNAAIKETGLSTKLLPAEPIWTAEKILNRDFFPET